MRHAIVVAMAWAAMMMAGTAAAESWEGRTELRPDSKSTCPQAALILAFNSDGTTLTARGKGRNPLVLSGPVAADGKVDLYGRTGALGQVALSGNARSRQMQITSSTYPGCVYAVVAGDMNAGLVSAYQGTGGDWSLGRWEGRIVGNFAGIGLREQPRALIIDKLADGRVGCRYGEPDYVASLAWVPDCAITGSAIQLRTLANSTVELTRSAADRLEGRVREAGTAQAYTVFLAR